MTRPKLLFISNLFPDKTEPHRGLDNATLLHALSADYEIRVISPRPSLRRRLRVSRDVDHHFWPAYVNAPYVPKFGHRYNHRLMASALRPEIARVRQTFKFDLVLCSWVFPDGCAVAQLAREHRFAFVAIAQGSDVHQYLKIPARREIIVESMACADAIVARSAELTRLLAEAGVAREKIHTIYNGVDFSIFHEAKRGEARRELGIKLDARVVLFVGNFFPIKNPLLLIEAIAELAKDPAMDKLELVMIGGGPLEKPAMKRADELGIEGRVRFAGRKNSAEIARHMQAADVLCLPSEHEGVPNVILEALACGLPVVASRVGGIPEVVAHDFLGTLVPPGDLKEFILALHKQLLIDSDRAAIAAYARLFSWPAAVAEYKAIFDRVYEKRERMTNHPPK